MGWTYARTNLFNVPEYRRHELAVAVARAMPSLQWRHHATVGALQAYLTERDPEVRVHIWHPSLLREGAENEGQIHDHRFDLRSTVLFGKIRHEEFHLTDDIEGDYRKYTVINARQGRIDQPDLMAGMFKAEIRTGEIEAGWTYTFPQGEFHRTVACSDLAVSLVTKENQQERKAVLLVHKEYATLHPIRHGMDNPPIDKEQYWIKAANALMSGARR